MNLNLENSAAVQEFGQEFLKEFSKFPFGSMPKRDVECLIFHLLEKHKIMNGDDNRSKSENLSITESRLKSYALDADVKYGSPNLEENVRRLMERLCNSKDAGLHTNVWVDDSYVVFIEENPVIKRDFAQALKKSGYYTDTSFNTELVKVRTASFIAFALEEMSVTKENIAGILKSSEVEENLFESIDFESKDFKEICSDVFGILRNQESSGINTALNFVDYFSKLVKSRMPGS